MVSPTSKRDRVCACAANHHLAAPAHASTTEVSFEASGSSDYLVGGQADPDVKVCKDTAITFKRTDAGHPLRIVSAADCAGKGCESGSWTSLPTSTVDGFTGDIGGNSQLNLTLTEGTYYYLCSSHPNMVGKLIVDSCANVCQECGSGETRLAGDAKDGAVTSCCSNGYQLSAQGQCQATVCDATSEVVRTELTASSDRVCKCAENHRYDGSGSCLACGSGETRLEGDLKEGSAKACCLDAFQSSSNEACQAHSTCPVGQGKVADGTASTDTQCSTCEGSTFSAVNDKSECQEHSTCPVGQGKTVDGTASTDIECSICEGTTFSSVNDRSACQEHSTCPVGQGKTANGTASADTQCTTCSGTTFSAVNDKSACQEHSTCPVGQGKVADGTASTDTQCSTCEGTTFSAVNDKSACQDHSTCPVGQGKTVDGTSSTDIECSACEGTTFSSVNDRSACQGIQLAP